MLTDPFFCRIYYCIRCASEDVGLADPTALPLAVAAFQGCQLIGKPECDVLLAQATVHLGKSCFLTLLSTVLRIRDPVPF
jgi:replication-associated recombination protein RarA